MWWPQGSSLGRQGPMGGRAGSFGLYISVGRGFLNGTVGPTAPPSPTLVRVGSPRESSGGCSLSSGPGSWVGRLGDRQPVLEMLPYSVFPWSST